MSLNLMLTHNQKNVLKKSINIYFNMAKLNFKPYLKCLDEYHKNDIQERTNIEFYIINAQRKMAKIVSDDDIKNNDKIKVLSNVKNKLNKEDYNFSDVELAEIKNATENLSRVGMGQIDYCIDVINMQWGKIVLDKNYSVIREQIDAADKIMELDGRSKVEADNAWDIYQVVRHYLAWKSEPEGGFQVSFDKPLKKGSEPLAKILTDDEIKERNIEYTKKVSEKKKRSNSRKMS